MSISLAWAGPPERDREAARLTAQGQAPLTAKEDDQLLTRGWRDRRPDDSFPPVTALVRPSDYDNDFKRGTISFVPKQPNEKRARWRNYSHHTIEIPDGTVMDAEELGACNFAQMTPQTDAIVRTPGLGHNLTFRGCNLTNVKTYPDWTIEGCQTMQAWYVDTDPDPTIENLEPQVIGRCADQRSQSECVKPAELLSRPANAVTRRGF